MNKKAIIAVSVIMVAMAAGVITLGVLFGREKKARAETENVLEAHYQQSYYTLLDETNDLEIKFAKLTVARGKTTRLSLLSDAVKSGELAVCALSALSGSDVSIENTISEPDGRLFGVSQRQTRIGRRDYGGRKHGNRENPRNAENAVAGT